MPALPNAQGRRAPRGGVLRTFPLQTSGRLSLWLRLPKQDTFTALCELPALLCKDACPINEPVPSPYLMLRRFLHQLTMCVCVFWSMSLRFRRDWLGGLANYMEEGHVFHLDMTRVVEFASALLFSLLACHVLPACPLYRRFPFSSGVF